MITKFIAPVEIKIKSDNNIIQLMGFNKHSSMYVYKYIVSKTKRDMLLSLTESQLIHLIDTQRIIPELPEIHTSQVLDNHTGKKISKKNKKEHRNT